jgi:hypothetical protein
MCEEKVPNSSDKKFLIEYENPLIEMPPNGAEELNL